MISRDEVRAVLGDGGVVVGDAGLDLGRIRQVFLDELSYEPAWMTVTSDTWGGAEVVVPLELAWLDEGRISVPYSTAVVRDAPRADTSVGLLGAQHEQDLLRHYGLDAGDAVSAEPVLDGRVDGISTATQISGRERFFRHRHSATGACRASERPSVRCARSCARSWTVSSLPGDELDDLVLATLRSGRQCRRAPSAPRRALLRRPGGRRRRSAVHHDPRLRPVAGPEARERQRARSPADERSLPRSL